jgi:hypothetical protein
MLRTIRYRKAFASISNIKSGESVFQAALETRLTVDLPEGG